MNEELYYIQSKRNTGNCLLWWREGGHGYTCNLDEAWKVCKEKADSLAKRRPEQDIPRRCSIVDAVATRHCDSQLGL